MKISKLPEIEEHLLNYLMVHKPKCHLTHQTNIPYVSLIGKLMTHTIASTLRELLKNYGHSVITYWWKEETSQSMNKLPLDSNKSIYHSERMEREF